MPSYNITLYAQWVPATMTISYNGNGSTGGSVPTSHSAAYGSNITVKGNTGNLLKPNYQLIRWNTNASGTGATCAFNETFPLTGNMTLYAQWARSRTTNMKLWVDKTYADAYTTWSTQASEIAARAAMPFNGTYAITINISAPTLIDSGKSSCPNAPNACTVQTCGPSCASHHTNSFALLNYVSNNKDNNYAFNTMLYYGTTSCSSSDHSGAGGRAYCPGRESIVQCYDYTNWLTIRRVQHEWSHNLGAQHSGEGGTYCTSDCINNGGMDKFSQHVPNIWCRRCENAMASEIAKL